ncbi:MAG: phcB protein [Acidobacteriales bacterium]|nr:phcB protein [Terriglobales bacterium]
MPNELEYLLANDKQLLASKSSRIVFQKDQVIIREGAPSKAVYFLREGAARVYRSGMSPDSRLATLTAGDVFGEMAFLEGVPASASVIADGTVTVDAIETPTLHSVFETFPHLGARFFRSVAVLLSRRLRETSKQLSQARPAK